MHYCHQQPYTPLPLLNHNHEQELFLTAALSTKGGEPAPGALWGLRSRAVTPYKDKDKLKWHERLVMELPKGGCDSPSTA